MSHTSGEAAFPRPRLGQVLTPLGVNIIALVRNVITDYVKLNCYIYQSEDVSLFCCMAKGFRRWFLPFLEQGEQVSTILVHLMLFGGVQNF